MMKKLYTFFTILVMSLSFGCAGIDLNNMDANQTAQIAKIGQQIISQLDPAQLAKIISDVQKELDKNKPPVIPPVTPPVTPPDPPVITDPVAVRIVVADLNTIPGRMRQAGFNGSDNALWYTLAFVAAFGPGEMPDDGAGSLIELSKRTPEVEIWWNSEIDKVIQTMRSNPLATAVAIENDGRDRCGFRLGPAIVNRLQEFGSRVQLGTTLDPSQY